MVKKETHYTPTIEEFHVGFEFEYKSDRHGIYDNTNGEFKKEAFTGSGNEVDGLEVHFIQNNLTSGNIRVKHLDQEDIESLGWESTGSAWYNLKNVPGALGYYLYVKMRFFEGEALIKAFRYDPLGNPDYQEETNLFDGKIKNKSELKKLMQMLSII